LLWAKALTKRIGSEAFLHDGNEFALTAANVVSGRFDDGSEAIDEERQQRRDEERNERKHPVQPEHDSDYPDDGEAVDQEVENRTRHEVLDGVDVVGDGADQGPGLLTVVEGHRETLEVGVDALAKVVGDALADADGVIGVEIRAAGLEERGGHGCGDGGVEDR
jgi:hypothetical protein